MTEEFKPSAALAKAQAIAKRKRDEMIARRSESYIAGSPGTLGDGNTNNSAGGDTKGPMQTWGLDE